MLLSANELLSTELLGGMPVVTLTDLARLRLDSISFFLFLIVVATFVVRWCWNTIAADFPKLPQLSIGKSFATVTLWGLVFLLALTMISGARELLTPGAWEKHGYTYKIRDENSSADNDITLPLHERNIESRRQRLSQAYALLELYAQEHSQQFPERLVDAIAADHVRHPPEWPSADYEYYAGYELGSRGERLLAEPNIYLGTRFSLLVGGVIVEE